jgi:transcriptional regulator with XRE-family HTH domain
MQDLKSIREAKNLTQNDLAGLSGLPQSHISAIELGKLAANKRTRRRLERVLGPVNWLTTLAVDRSHIGYALKELINLDHPGVRNRINFCKQYLNELAHMMKSIEEKEIETHKFLYDETLSHY